MSKICKTLNADFGDIVEYVPDAEIWDLYDENRELIGREHVRGEQPAENALSGNYGYHQEMDWTPTGLGTDPLPT